MGAWRAWRVWNSRGGAAVRPRRAGRRPSRTNRRSRHWSCSAIRRRRRCGCRPARSPRPPPAGSPRSWCCASGGSPRRSTEDAVLLVSELVGNAVRHTGARVFGLRMLRRRGWIRIEVRDPSRGLPCLMPVQETGHQRPGALPRRQALRPLGRGPAAARQDDLVRDAGDGERVSMTRRAEVPTVLV